MKVLMLHEESYISGTRENMLLVHILVKGNKSSIVTVYLECQVWKKSWSSPSSITMFLQIEKLRLRKGLHKVTLIISSRTRIGS